MSTQNSKPSLFERIKTGLEEGICHARGKQSLKTITLDSEPPELNPQEIVAARESVGMSQAVLANTIGVALKTVRAWEKGTQQPSPVARRFLQVFLAKPTMICEVIGIKLPKQKRRQPSC